MSTIKRIVLYPFSPFIDGKNRATRQEYWLYTIAYFVLIFALGSLPSTWFVSDLGVLFIPWMNISLKRIHDFNQGDWLSPVSSFAFIFILVVYYYRS